MFVTKNQLKKEIRVLERRNAELVSILRAAVGEKAYNKAVKAVESESNDPLFSGSMASAGFYLDNDTTVDPVVDNKWPPNDEYQERFNKAVKMFKAGMTVTEVSTRMGLGMTTVYRYLREALRKRKITKAEHAAIFGRK